MACRDRVVAEYQDEALIEVVRWYCNGNCDDGQACRLHVSVVRGVVRIWCGCTPVEPATCHLVYVIPPEGKGERELLCAGTCPKGAGFECLPHHKVGMTEPPGIHRDEVTCRCVRK